MHHRIRDPYLRFWLRRIGPDRDRIDRGRGDIAAEQISASWSSYRGVAVEPPVAEALSLLLPDGRFGAVAAPTVMGGPDGDAPLGAEVLRRATDMNDPGGTFMDGYVAGRLTERAEVRTHSTEPAVQDDRDGFGDTARGWSGGDMTWDELDAAADADTFDDMTHDW